MKKIACIYTASGGLEKIVENEMSKVGFDNLKYTHIVDNSLIRDIVASNGLTSELENRTLALFDAANAIKPECILCTCSSIGEIAEKYAVQHKEVPVYRIDYAMANIAASKFNNVAVMATLSTTIGPSVSLIERLAREKGRNVEVKAVTATGAFEALMSGNIEEANNKVKKAAEGCKGVDCVVLAQASMSRFASILNTVLPGVPLLSSPDTCAAYLKEVY